jgi:hypothetical protein
VINHFFSLSLHYSLLPCNLFFFFYLLFLLTINFTRKFTLTLVIIPIVSIIIKNVLYLVSLITFYVFLFFLFSILLLAYSQKKNTHNLILILVIAKKIYFQWSQKSLYHIKSKEASSLTHKGLSILL